MEGTMKNNLAVLAVLALAAVAAVPASAQSTTLKANIPFEFSAGTSVMPAGDYTVKGGWGSSSVLIRSDDSSAAAYLAAQAGQTARGSEGNSKLVFHRVGDQYFLRQIVNGSLSMVRDFPLSTTERELAGRVNSAKAYETVVILARL